ncbi:MAG: glycosyltransferase family 2 protein, partial [Terrimicrobiaceae bacterium]|nr:glycosyltransferase family 2 protein [Terrimicrobiaceae bacterium]
MKISVVIPARNAAGLVGDAVASALRQSLAPHEVIVVDDGSADGTAEAAERAGARVARLAAGGVSRARNVGARLASGEALLFLDADDVLLPHALEKLVGGLSAGRAVVAYGMVIERTRPPKLPRLNGFGFAAGDPPAPARANFWRCAVATPGSALVRADGFREAGGFVTGYEPLEDRDLFMKCGMLGPAVFCDTVVLDKRWLPGSHGSQHARRIFRGQRAQRDFGSWCAARGLDASWLPGSREIVRRALDEALWRREFGILRPLLAEARR